MNNNLSEQNDQDYSFIDRYTDLVNDIQYNKSKLEGLKNKCDSNIDKLKVFDKLIKKVDRLKIY